MPSKVLIVEDDATNRLILQRLLEREGFSVVLAHNGEEGVRAYEREQPDLVLMDVMMPVMNGYDATRRIKALQNDRFTPVIFLTAIQDESALAACVDAGGDDFLTKPYNHVILRSKIQALLRIGELHATVREQNAQLNLHHQYLEKERAIAEKIFNSVVRPGSGNFSGIKYLLAPTSVFNGDLLLMARSVSGKLHFMVGDFTGHGLAAAIGAVPVSDIFYAMTANGFSIGDIAEAINRKLKTMLPTNYFLAACLVSLDVLENSITVWNGGIPDVLIVDAQSRIRARVPSSHLPLGVSPAAAFERSCDFISVDVGDHVYVCSDGVIDAPIASGGRFGKTGYEECFDARIPPAQRFDFIVGSLRELQGDGPKDDVTLIEVEIGHSLAREIRLTEPRNKLLVPTNWTAEFRFDAHTLRDVNPVPLLLHVLSEVQGLERHKEALFTVIAELFINALDHGVLRLDSAVKSLPGGFMDYYAERAARLARLDEGYVEIALRHRATESGGILTLVVKDSGEGFSSENFGAGRDVNKSASGRGIPLLRSLCTRLEYLGSGNHVEAEYSWKP